MPNVLIVSHGFPGLLAGGTEVFTESLVAALSLRGHDVVWAAPVNKDKVATARIPLRGISLSRAATPGDGWQEEEARIALELRRGLSELDFIPDVVHATHFAAMGLAFLDEPPLDSVPLVVTAMDYWIVCPDSQLFDWGTDSICSGLVPPVTCERCTGGRAQAASLRKWRSRNVGLINDRAIAVFAQTPEQSDRLVKNGVDPDLIVSKAAAWAVPREWRIPGDARRSRNPFRFGIFSRISPEKGIDIAVKAMLSARDPSFELHIWGVPDDPEYQLTVESLVARSSNTYLHGPVALPDLGAVMWDHDCMLVPSIWLENHPHILTYAQALGLPTIMSAVPSLAHLRNLDGFRLLDDYRSPDAWAEAMFEAYQSPNGNKPPTFGAALERFEDLVDTLDVLYERATA